MTGTSEMYTFRDEIYRKYSVYDFDHDDLSFFQGLFAYSFER